MILSVTNVETRRREILNMEPIRSWYGIHYAVVSTKVEEARPEGSETWSEVRRWPKCVVPGTVFPYTPDGHAKCLKVFRELREEQKQKEAETHAQTNDQ